MSKKSIFGNQTYMDFEFKFNTFPVYFALLPMSYVLPTLYIVCYTIFVFMEHYLRRKEFIVNSQIFLVVSMAHIVITKFHGDKRISLVEVLKFSGKVINFSDEVYTLTTNRAHQEYFEK
ncbi:hypothetical protein CRE_03422 [Caenorhabditis remanei]|uniref:Serpentine receptor class gamma n=1 Tax=Caenorhabditis remanei TaxID=31234 RepID=E3NAM8_CAERE|nr:hypothetical protein CRE_03422 [Caenorhabditis remanei]